MNGIDTSLKSTTGTICYNWYLFSVANLQKLRDLFDLFGENHCIGQRFAEIGAKLKILLRFLYYIVTTYACNDSSFE